MYRRKNNFKNQSFEIAKLVHQSDPSNDTEPSVYFRNLPSLVVIFRVDDRVKIWEQFPKTKRGRGSRSFPNSNLGFFLGCCQSQIKNVFYYDPKKT